MRYKSLVAAILILFLSAYSHAMRMGNAEVNSHLGEPLDFTVKLNSIDAYQFSTLHVSLASRETFRKAGIRYPDTIDSLYLELGEYGNGYATLRVRSTEAVNEPFVNLLLEMAWSGGKIIREFTLLIDPDDYPVAHKPIAKTTEKAPEEASEKVPVASAPAPDSTPNGGPFHQVKKGESLSAIAARYRPKDTTPQQAWVAFYKLNQSAFPEGNINKTSTGMRLQIPSDEQMRALSHREAALEVKRLSGA